jgi:hypothetical protein
MQPSKWFYMMIAACALVVSFAALLASVVDGLLPLGLLC